MRFVLFLFCLYEINHKKPLVVAKMFREIGVYVRMLEFSVENIAKSSVLCY